MPETQKVVAAQALTVKESASRTNAFIAYGIMVFGLLSSLVSLVAAIWTMIKKSDAEGTKFYDHYLNIITIFWVGLRLRILLFSSVFDEFGVILLGSVDIVTII